MSAVVRETPLDLLLGRLAGVRQTGHGWLARCPGHDDRSPSLSIGTGENGRILLHCFAGCDSACVLAAVGLELGDLFERPRDQPASPAARAERRRAAQIADVGAVARVLDREATIIQIVGAALLRGEPLSSEDATRFALARERIGAAREALAHGH